MIDQDRFFRLIGHTTIFRVVREYKAAGFIPSIHGHTIDDRYQTCARIIDVVWLSAEETSQ